MSHETLEVTRCWNQECVSVLARFSFSVLFVNYESTTWCPQVRLPSLKRSVHAPKSSTSDEVQYISGSETGKVCSQRTIELADGDACLPDVHSYCSSIESPTVLSRGAPTETIALDLLGTQHSRVPFEAPGTYGLL